MSQKGLEHWELAQPNDYRKTLVLKRDAENIIENINYIPTVYI